MAVAKPLWGGKRREQVRRQAAAMSEQDMDRVLVAYEVGISVAAALTGRGYRTLASKGAGDALCRLSSAKPADWALG
jgi:hypothetical protein